MPHTHRTMRTELRIEMRTLYVDVDGDMDVDGSGPLDDPPLHRGHECIANDVLSQTRHGGGFWHGYVVYLVGRHHHRQLSRFAAPVCG